MRQHSYSLVAKIDVNVTSVFTSRKLSQSLSVKENKPPDRVYLCQCDLCDANYVGSGLCTIFSFNFTGGVPLSIILYQKRFVKTTVIIKGYEIDLFRALCSRVGNT